MASIRPRSFTQLQFYRYSPYIFAVLAFGLILWTGWLFYHKPYTGAAWSYSSGLVVNIEKNSPAEGLLQPGDVIQRVDGLPVYEARGLPGHSAGDPVEFRVQRGSETHQVTVRVGQAPQEERISHLMISLIALAFWVLGAIILVFGKAGRLGNLFFLFCQVFALTLALGAISEFSPSWAWMLFGLLLWWIGPITFHTHLVLTSPAEGGKPRPWITGVYRLAILFTLADLVRMELGVAGPLLTFKYLWAGGFLIASSGLLLYRLRRSPSPEYRRRTRIAALAAGMAFSPFVFLSLIPDAVTGRYIIPYEVTFLALPILPLGYSYAIFLHQLVRTEKTINQSAAYASAAFLVTVLNISLFTFLTRLFPYTDPQVSGIWLAGVVVLALLIYPEFSFLFRWVKQVLYGGWMDDRLIVRQISNHLKESRGDIQTVAVSLCQALETAMQLKYVHLLSSSGQLFSSHARRLDASGGHLFEDEQRTRALFQHIRGQTGRELGPGEELLGVLNEQGERAKELLGDSPQLWLIFGDPNGWQGLLILGNGKKGNELESKDMEVLELVLRQAAAALENAYLLDEVRHHSRQIHDLHQQVLRAREEERKRVARDIHDMTIQTLVGVNYQLSSLRELPQDELDPGFRLAQNNLRDALSELRRICSDLRPPALDVLGLVTALDSRISEMRTTLPFELNVSLEPIDDADITDEVSICLYRFVQEALTNAQRHSMAQQVWVNLSKNADDEIHLSIADNGRGFDLPANLEELVVQSHFGLIGIQELVEAVGGRVEINTSPGSGCRIEVNIPLKKFNSESEMLAIRG